MYLSIRLSLLLFVLSSCSASTLDESNIFSRPKVLVLIESHELKYSHSTYLENLNRDFDVTITLVDEPNIKIKDYDNYLYENIVLFAPSLHEFGSNSLSVDSLIDFVDNGKGNLLVSASQTKNLGSVVRDLAYSFGVELEETGKHVIDHIQFDENLDELNTHTSIFSRDVDKSFNELFNQDKDWSQKVSNGVLFRGIGMKVKGDGFNILKAGPNAYSYKVNKKVTVLPNFVGSNISLVSGVQLKNNARVVFSGSLDMFSNKFLTSSSQYANKPWVSVLSKWAFKRIGVLRVVNVDHRLKGEQGPPEEGIYTIKDDVVYSIRVEEFDEIRNMWKPFVPISKERSLQMEFVRIDPFVRLTLKHKSDGLFVGEFKIPDVYGVYQFKVEYNYPGFTSINSVTQYGVRPLKHDQYERFIESAHPYYVSAFSMMGGVWLFALVFLHYRVRDDVKVKHD